MGPEDPKGDQGPKGEKGDTGYSKSQETHSIKVRQQDPTTKLWSLCEVNSYISAGGARTSVRVQWSEYDVSYEVPETT